MKTLRQCRAESGLTQKDVAAQLGVSTDTMTRWESGQTYPNALQVIKLASIYGTAIDEIDWVMTRIAAPKDQSILIKNVTTIALDPKA